MSNLIDRAALTNEAIDELVQKQFPGITLSPETYSRELARWLTDAATEKAVRVVLKELEPLVEAARTITDVAWGQYSSTEKVTCPHGNSPHYPTHGWWCDACFTTLQEALAYYADLNAEL